MTSTPPRPPVRHRHSLPARVPEQAQMLVRGPEDVVALVPSVLGFHPTGSVVLVCFGGGGRSFHARVDLPVDDAEREAVAEQLVTAATANGAATAIVLAYSEAAATAELVCRHLLARLLAEGIAVAEVLRVARGRFHVLDEEDGGPGFHGPGTPVDVAVHPFTAQQVLAGRVTHLTRDHLAATLRPTDPDDVLAVERAAAGWADDVARRLIEEAERGAEVETGTGTLPEVPVTCRDEAEWVALTVARLAADVLIEHDVLDRCAGHAGGAADPSVDDVGRLLTALSLDAVQEVVWTALRRPDARAHVELWTRLVRRAAPPLLPGVAGLAAFSAWLAGEGALAWCAVERAAEVPGSHRLVDLVARLLEDAVSPEAWRPFDPAVLAVNGGEGAAPSSGAESRD